MIKMDELLNAPLPIHIRYTGRTEVKPRLRDLTIVSFENLNIGFLSENGSKACKMKGGGLMWILDVCINYTLSAPER